MKKSSKTNNGDRYGSISKRLQWRGLKNPVPRQKQRSVGAVRQRQRGEGRGKHLAAG